MLLTPTLNRWDPESGVRTRNKSIMTTAGGGVEHGGDWLPAIINQPTCRLSFATLGSSKFSQAHPSSS